MHQLQVIQDWGFDYLYLHHDDATIRVHLVDYTYGYMHVKVDLIPMSRTSLARW